VAQQVELLEKELFPNYMALLLGDQARNPCAVLGPQRRRGLLCAGRQREQRQRRERGRGGRGEGGQGVLEQR
jgi:hypothetical protein